jgi:hypothetical protein
MCDYKSIELTKPILGSGDHGTVTVNVDKEHLYVIKSFNKLSDYLEEKSKGRLVRTMVNSPMVMIGFDDDIRQIKYPLSIGEFDQVRWTQTLIKRVKELQRMRVAHCDIKFKNVSSTGELIDVGLVTKFGVKHPKMYGKIIEAFSDLINEDVVSEQTDWILLFILLKMECSYTGDYDVFREASYLSETSVCNHIFQYSDFKNLKIKYNLRMDIFCRRWYFKWMVVNDKSLKMRWHRFDLSSFASSCVELLVSLVVSFFTYSVIILAIFAAIMEVEKVPSELSGLIILLAFVMSILFVSIQIISKNSEPLPKEKVDEITDKLINSINLNK